MFFKRSRKIALALSISFALAFLAGEIGARILYGAPWPEKLPILQVAAHPTRGWKMVENQGHYTYDQWVEVNSLGLRGPEPGVKSPDRLRVLALGDSLVYGQGAGEDETLPVYLEGELNARDPHGRNWELINAGHRAYDTRQELALLEEFGPELEPDVVVLFWFHNDLFGRNVEATNRSLSASGPVAFDTGDNLQGRYKLEWQLKQVLRKSALVMRLYDQFLNHDAERDISAAKLEPRFEIFAAQLDRLLELEREQGFQLFFGVLPFGPALDLSSDRTEPHWGDPLAERALEMARDRGIPAMLLDEEVRTLTEETGKLPVIPFDGHFLPEGNEALARSAASFLLAVL